MARESKAKVFGVAFGVCFACSLLVASAAVGLKPLQEEAAKIDLQRNILFAAAKDEAARKEYASMSSEKVEKAFESIDDLVVDLDTGKDITSEAYSDEKVRAKYNQIQAAEFKLAGKQKPIDKENDLARIKIRENHGHVYVFTDPETKKKTFILPVRGKGLWSTLKGFVALQEDLETCSYLTFYSHKETPGLGGEVDNKGWKQKWNGKVLVKDGKPVIKVVKTGAKNDTEMDGLSGATVTSNGVEKLLHFWLGPNGYGKYLDSVRSAK